jgi:alpha-N-arabinofuranosidase
LGFWRKNEMPDYLSCIMLSNGPEQTIVSVIDILDEAGYRGKIKIAFDEWNLRGWHHPGFPRKSVSAPHDPKVKELIQARDKNAIASQYTMADALFSASFLNACLRHPDDIGMANIAPIVNTRGPLYVHPKGIVKRTTFHVLAMYANLLGNHFVNSKITSGLLVHGNQFVPIVDAIVTVDGANKTWKIALINRHPSKEVDCRVCLKNTLLEGSFEATVLDGDSPEAYNDIENPRRVSPKKVQLTFQKNVAKLPPHSLTIVRIQDKSIQ